MIRLHALRGADRRGAPPPVLVRGTRLLVLAILIGIGISQVIFAVIQWPLGDMDVYLHAAERLRDGQPLYATGGPVYTEFRYAPWFAAVWVPLSYLPRLVVAIIWSTLLVGATAGVGLQLGRLGRNGVLLALVLVPPLFAVAAGGNVQPLMVLALLLGLNRRSGPLWVALAASLKFTPILLTLVYVARREWLRAALSLLLTTLLFAPAVPMGHPLLESGAWSGTAPSLLGISPPIYLLVVGLSVAATLLVPARAAPLAASVAAVLALPRLFLYDVTLIAVGVAGRARAR